MTIKFGFPFAVAIPDNAVDAENIATVTLLVSGERYLGAVNVDVWKLTACFLLATFEAASCSQRTLPWDR